MAKGQEFAEIESNTEKWQPQLSSTHFLYFLARHPLSYHGVIVLNSVIACFIALVLHPMLFPRGEGGVDLEGMG